MPLFPGTRFGPYEIVEPIGSGGMGDVYKAHDSRLKRDVAVKVLSAASGGGSDYRRRFIQEGQAASALNHPNIITIHDVVSQDGTDVMVMEYLNGQTLADLIPVHGLPVATVLSYAVQMADALSVAHAAGIIHRDLKPGNVMITSSGLVKILDFGLAKITSGVIPADQGSNPNADTLPLSGPMTVEGSIVGTVSYMSPEQAEARAIDARSDVFSFGLTVYEMLTGQRAFSDSSSISTLTMILRDEAKPISSIVQGVPQELEQIINRALRKNPEQRWQTMQEMHAELVRLKHRLDSRMIDVRPLPAPRKRRLVAIVGVAAVLAVLAFAGWWTIHRPTSVARQPQVAQSQPPIAPAPAAPTAPAPTAVAPAAEDPVMTNQSVVDMLQSKVPVSAIISHLRSSPTRFDLTTAEIIRLTKSGATAELLDAMRNPRAAAVPPKLEAAAVPAPTAAPLVPAPPSSLPAVSTRAVPVYGGIPLSVTLNEDMPLNVTAGQLLHFTVAKDLVLRESVIVAQGTPVDGEVVDTGGESKMLGMRKSKATFRVSAVTATDGSKLAIRAVPGRRPDRVTGNIEPPGHRDKDKLAATGSQYLVYIDGDQAVNVKK